MHGGSARSSPMADQPVILCVDADTFFLAVHEREDPTLRNRAVALWQYNDIVCASRKARALGVTKHMTPLEARPLIEPAGGRMVHSYWRDWPGPRIWYGPYNAASRQLFAALGTALATVAPRATVERASIDEAYVDLTLDASAAACQPGGEPPMSEALFGAAERAAHALIAALDASGIDLKVSVGVAPNKLLAKLASGRAKGSASRACVLHDATDVEALLRETAAAKLPGLGSKKAELEAAGLATAVDLRRLSVPELQASRATGATPRTPRMPRHGRHAARHARHSTPRHGR
eukprot:688935-Prymnesium_polylepis.1